MVAAVSAVALMRSPLRPVSEASCRSRALGGTLRYAVSLPPDYGTSHARYPVVYFLHGLPASPYAFRQIGFVTTALAGLRRTAIVAVPQGARGGDSDPEYLDWGRGRNWAMAISSELTRCVDRRYRTIRSRRGRALVGLSAGGYGVGSEDKRFRAENEQLDRELRAAGVPHLFRIYPGAHDQTVWRVHARDWLRLVLAHLARARQ
jgi:enterochelin esterase-like enzyme